MSRARARPVSPSRDRLPVQAKELREAMAARQLVSFTCERGHRFQVPFAASIVPPEAWQCTCGRPAGLGEQPAVESQLQRRMAQIRERRTVAELEQALAERLAGLSQMPSVSRDTNTGRVSPASVARSGVSPRRPSMPASDETVRSWR